MQNSSSDFTITTKAGWVNRIKDDITTKNLLRIPVFQFSSGFTNRYENMYFKLNVHRNVRHFNEERNLNTIAKKMVRSMPALVEDTAMIMEINKADVTEGEGEEWNATKISNTKIIESILFGTAETIAIICEYRNLLRKVDKCKEVFSYEVKNSPSVPPPSIQPDTESNEEFQFHPRHVAMMLEKFVQIDRLSMVDISSFVFLLEDLIALSKLPVVDKGVYLPGAWLNLKLPQLKKLSRLIMVQREFINWKNFILACMELPFPTQEEILDALAQYRTLDPDITNYIDKNKFDLVTLWFEPTDPFVIARDFNLQRWRECLYQLFCDNFNQFQYIEFLLYFCKDVDPRVGLANSLALLTGHIVPVDEFPELDKSENELHVTDSELETLFSDDDLITHGDSGAGSNLFSPVRQKVNLTRRMTILKERRERLQQLQEGNQEEMEVSTLVEEETEGELETRDERNYPGNEAEDTVARRRIHAHFSSDVNSESPKLSLEDSKNESAQKPQEKSIGERNLSQEALLEVPPNTVQDTEDEFEQETEGEMEMEGEYYEEGKNKVISPPPDEGREISGERKSTELVKPAHEKKGKGKKNKRTDSVTAGNEGKLKKGGSQIEKKEKDGAGGKNKKGGKKGQKQQIDSKVPDAKSKSNKQMEKDLESDEISPAPDQIHFEEEEEWEEEEDDEEEQEEEIVNPAKLIPMEAFLQSLWFGHITAYPIRNQSFHSQGFEKLKEFIESVYEEHYMKYGHDAVDPYNANLLGILQHPFVREILDRYKGFEILDLGSKVREIINMPEEPIENLPDSASSMLDSESSVEHIPLRPSPLLSASSYNDSFSEIFSCLSLNSRGSEKLIHSENEKENGRVLSPKRLSRDSIPSALLIPIGYGDEEGGESADEGEGLGHTANAEDYALTAVNSKCEFNDESVQVSMVDIFKSPDLTSPRHFASFNPSFEDLESQLINENESRLEMTIEISNESIGLDLEEEWGGREEESSIRNLAMRLRSGENRFNEEDIENIVPVKSQPQSATAKVIKIESSTQIFNIKSLRQAHRTQVQKSAQKFSPMKFGLDPQLGSLLF